ncbi:MAG: AMP-binding protein [Endomicrobium sp.]|jgi:acyl-[acyl-carrier-protein]-phospholipid O-acyltransferase/long-chain-fatty-acid--[acyl-carrier-protein] ligase|nr:AMP-binding protein [Endomicrobium sp.]
MKKLKRLIIALVFPKALLLSAVFFALLITVTILSFIPPAFGWTLTLALICITIFLLLFAINNPVLTMHGFIWLLNHTFYKIRAVGCENLPEKGGGLIVSNSVSYIDVVLIFSAIKRPVKFFVNKDFSEHPFLKPFLNSSNSIPIDPDGNPKAIGNALKDARRTIQNGGLVCIFAEGELTRTGLMLPFKRGYEFVIKNLDVPIIPLHLDRIWGSTFSFVDRKLKWRIPEHVPYPVTVSIGKPLPSSSLPFEVRLAVQELGAEAFKLRGDKQKKLHIGFIREAKKHPFKFCFGELGKSLNYMQAFSFAASIAQRLKDNAQKDEKVGIFLPTSAACAVANIAVLSAGKIPVNLNYTYTKDILQSCISQCEMKQIITSRVFCDKVGMHHFDDMKIYAEDIAAGVSKFEKIKNACALLFLPIGLIIKKYVKGGVSDINDVAAIIFSSGTTGIPKGIMLTHQNIVSNIEGIYKITGAHKNDIIAGILPLFHAFGYTATFWLCAYYGIGAAFHSSPLESQKIGELVKKFKCTIIFATPTFVNSYVKKCTKEQFESLRIVISGAEKLKKNISNAFYEKFQKSVFEGYGATEASPVVSLGISSYIDPKTKKMQFGNKLGTVGHPLPGVAAKIVNRETYELLPFGQEGMLLVKGPNIMKGYLNDPQKTAEVIKDGWYVTGDISTIDEDGFIAITDRINRFSKIGGEMVPQIRVEEEIHNAAQADDHFAVVTSIEDEKRGERLIVLYKGEKNIDAILRVMYEKNLPKLWIPKKDNFYKVEEFPVLGTGKMDLKGIKNLAQRLSAGA